MYRYFSHLSLSMRHTTFLSSVCQGIYFATNERIIHRFWVLLGNLPRFSLRLDVLSKRTAISLRFKNEAFNISECYYSQLLFLFLNKMLSEQHVVGAACCLGINFATKERIIDHFWMLVGSLGQFSLRLELRKRTQAISLSCKNEAFSISEHITVRHYFCF